MGQLAPVADIETTPKGLIRHAFAAVLLERAITRKRRSVS
ncbi:hypothetical protein YW3DRAFT_06787 [Streptomyces sp. MnatMP-M77]|nr:hypothetical protein YW3DRAFT_06787 [Streptomyces sp. MnatMP-M77]